MVEKPTLKKMKRLYLLSILIFCAILSSCQNNSNEKITFNSRYFSLSYPSSWVRHKNEGYILTLTKYGKLEKYLHGGSPNIVVARLDSVEYHSVYQIKNVEQLLNKEFKVDEFRTITSLQKATKIKLNEDSVYMTKISIDNGLEVTIQYHYAYSHSGNYIVLYATHNDEEEEDAELHEIVNSLKINTFQSLEESLLNK